MSVGPFAFPRSLPTALMTPNQAMKAIDSHAGMTLRDYFAGQALAGICGDGLPGNHHLPAETAHDAYAYADAMLKAREAGHEQ